MEKKFFAIISVFIIVAMIFVSCSAGGTGEEAANTSENASVSDEATDISETQNSTEEATESTTKSTTETTTKPTTESTTKETTTAKPTTTQKETTTKKETTTQATTNETTTEATTKKETTTQKPTTTTTTKPATTTTTTTQKNVTPKEVQDQVNAYIKSKGLLFDAEYAAQFGFYGMTPENSSWSLRIARSQEDLNNGYTLRACKEEAELTILEDNPSEMYCYYDDEFFYVLYV